MDVTHLCCCCLRRSPDKDLTSPYQNQGKTEIYAQMVQECYNIPLILSGLGSPGICSVCVGRLQDAHDFKMQVQWSQAELQEWLRGDFSCKGEAEDRHCINVPSRPTDERRSRSRVPSRSRSRSQLRSRGRSASPSSQLDGRQRSRSRRRPRSQPRSRRHRNATSGKTSSRSRASRTCNDNRHIDTDIYEKLEVLLHNISSSLASAPTVTDNTLGDHTGNSEIKARLADLREPPRQSIDTLPPEFAHAGSCKQNNDNKNSSLINNNNKSSNENNNKSHTNKNKSNKRIKPVKALFCPRCRNNSHNLRQCKANKDEVFCFRCGHKGVKTPECPTCRQNRPSTSKK